MKKVLIVLFLLLSFVSNSCVYGLEGSFTSEEFLDGIAYTKYNGKIRYFKNAKSIRNVDTGQVAYCIEPFSDLVNYSDYDGTTSYDSRFGISQEKWEKIKLYAYYGYGYYGHTEDKWISITQMSIWRYLYPEYEFNWLDNVKSRNVIYPYESELNELNKLVNDHYKYPSFDKEYTIGINEGLTIVDNNDVLKYYTLKKSDFNLYLGINKGY